MCWTSSARASLRNALSGIRRAIGPGADRVLVATRERVGLAGDAEVWVDARAFEALIDAGQHEQALALCGGELLAGLDDEWVLIARDEHRERRAGALAALAAAAESAGNLAEAIRYSRERVALDPLDEPAHRDLFIRLARGGDRAGAMALYQRLADRLRRELGIAVSPQTRALADRLRAGQLDEVAAPAKTTFSLPAARDIAPPLPDLLAARRFRTAFVGRARQLAWLHQLWEDVVGGERRLALLVGEPGIGKTRLLAQFAASVCDLGAAVIYGRADEDALISYQPFVQAIRAAFASGVAPQDPDALAGIVPDLAHGSHALSPSTPEAASRLRMFEAACDVIDIAAAAAPTAAGARRFALGGRADAAAARAPGTPTAASACAAALRLPADRAQLGGLARRAARRSRAGDRGGGDHAGRARVGGRGGAARPVDPATTR